MTRLRAPIATTAPSPATARTARAGRSRRGDRRTIVASVTTRYRCTACGNLTRFDVTTSRRTRAFHHFTVGGTLSIEDVEVLAEHVEDVSCRWCGTGSSVATISEAELADVATDGADPDHAGERGASDTPPGSQHPA